MRIFNEPEHELIPSQRDYPTLLREMVDPPVPPYAMGQIAVLQKPMLAVVVGTRRMSSAASRIARELIPELVAAGFVIVSGLARGVDTLAHEVALASGGETVAVLGSGLGDIYPYENRDLALKIARNGVLVTEYAGKTGPRPWHFPARNRIIAGLSRGTWVIEAPQKSGALITADIALELGREVFATPGSIFDNHYEGCHALIQQGGAKLVMRANCILEEFGLSSSEHRTVSKTKQTPPLTEEEASLFACFLPAKPLRLDQIVECYGKSIVEVAPLVTELCTKGWLEETAWHCFLPARLISS